jgi:hypothetical protein
VVIRRRIALQCDTSRDHVTEHQTCDIHLQHYTLLSHHKDHFAHRHAVHHRSCSGYGETARMSHSETAV